MRLTFHQLRLLLAVSRLGSVTRAAQRLHLTQPTLSAQLRQLAEQVGLPLFERVGRKLHLTAAGHAVLDTAQRVEQELESLDETLAELRGDVVGRLQLAVVSTAETFIPRLLGDFRRERPAVEVSLVVLNRDAVTADWERRRLERSSGLLPDDTTIIAIRRRPNSRRRDRWGADAGGTA